MVWNASGAERVKSYRVYQELEAKYDAAMSRIADLETAIAFKDGLIRSLAAEIAMLPKSPAPQEVQHLHEEAADAHARSRSGSGVRQLVRPGAYSSADGTSERDDDPVEPDPVLSAIPVPSKRKKQS